MRSLHILFLISVLLLAGATALVYAKLSPQNELILHFTSLGEPDYVGTRVDLMGGIMTAGVLVLFNYILALLLRRRERFFGLVLMAASPVVALLLLIAVSVIIVNNQ